jgi:hypothetical protein
MRAHDDWKYGANLDRERDNAKRLQKITQWETLHLYSSRKVNCDQLSSKIKAGHRAGIRD